MKYLNALIITTKHSGIVKYNEKNFLYIYILNSYKTKLSDTMLQLKIKIINWNANTWRFWMISRKYIYNKEMKNEKKKYLNNSENVAELLSTNLHRFHENLGFNHYKSYNKLK